MCFYVHLLILSKHIPTDPTTEPTTEPFTNPSTESSTKPTTHRTTESPLPTTGKLERCFNSFKIKPENYFSPIGSAK